MTDHIKKDCPEWKAKKALMAKSGSGSGSGSGKGSGDGGKSSGKEKKTPFCKVCKSDKHWTSQCQAKELVKRHGKALIALVKGVDEDADAEASKSAYAEKSDQLALTAADIFEK